MKKLFNKLQAIIIGLLIIVISSIIIIIFMFSGWLNRENYNPDFGGLLGGALSGIGTLIAVSITINQSQKSTEKSYQNQQRPFLIVKDIHAEVIELLNTQTVIDAANKGILLDNKTKVYDVSYLQAANMWSILFSRYDNENTFVFPFKNSSIKIYFELTNIGIGPVIECHINFKYPTENIIVTNEIVIPAISPSQSYTFSYDIPFSIYVDNHIQQIEKYANLTISLKYKSILEIDSLQEISLETYSYNNQFYNVFISHCGSQKVL